MGHVDPPAVECQSCGTILAGPPYVPPQGRQPCPSCGSTARLVKLDIHDSITLRSKVSLKARRPGWKQPFREIVSGDDLHRKTDRWMRLRRLIDRKNDRYEERVTDPQTGAVVHECEEPLSEHRGRGSARGQPGS